ncbi:MAG TPA: hypothetical protein VM409_02905 [Chloroflexia bacterium]|nr:hypothetical protein [Chloroflexia bacterium]
MQTLSSSGAARRRRTFFLFLALVAALSSSWSQAVAAPSRGASHAGSAAGSYSFTTAASSLLSPTDYPVPATPAVNQGRFRYFPQTTHFLRGVFFTFWETHGATPILGLPITEALTEDGMVVQYLERVRMEWHPEVSNDPNKQVLLTRLGSILTEGQGRLFERPVAGADTPSSHFFSETGHNLSNAFLTFWQRNGGLAVYGYPISEEVVETNAADGREYTVQYFERNRFEWHPERTSANNVQIGLLGVEYARKVGLNPMSRILLPGEVAGADQDMTESPELAGLVERGLLPAIQALGRTPQFRWVPSVIIQNNIAVEFQEIDEEDVGGAFVTTRSRSRPYVIIVPDTQRTAPMEALASVLAHESTHAYDVVTGALSTRTGCSIEAETRAYMNGLAAWVLLKGDDALSQRYDTGTFEASVNRSLKGFNAGKTQLEFDFSFERGKQYLRGLYGADCGS